MVRKRGFEPPRGCPRQPLKLVRLPFRHFREAESRIIAEHDAVGYRHRGPAWTARAPSRHRAVDVQQVIDQPLCVGAFDEEA
jgi:hypothetical protein